MHYQNIFRDYALTSRMHNIHWSSLLHMPPPPPHSVTTAIGREVGSNICFTKLVFLLSAFILSRCVKCNGGVPMPCICYYATELRALLYNTLLDR
jgi:hypothetical protein